MVIMVCYVLIKSISSLIHTAVGENYTEHGGFKQMVQEILHQPFQNHRHT